MRLIHSSTLLALVLMLPCVPLPAQELLVQAAAADSISLDHEARLIKALDEISRNRIDEALLDLEYLVGINPNFRLAQLVYADLLMARSTPITDFGNLSHVPYREITALREEALARWRHYHAPNPAGRIPRSLVQMDQNHKYAIVVDLTMPRLYVFSKRDGIPVLVANFYVTIGKNGFGKYREGDKRTPVGVYFATDFIAPSELPDLYGDGAFPINYPNAWDRRNGYSGYGIWLHGTPSNTYSRPPRDSDGCVILSNDDLMALAPYIEAGRTPVILAQSIEWIGVEDWIEQQQEFSQFVEQWRRDWESRNTDLYLSHYSRDYSGLGMNYSEWVSYKRSVNLSKKFIKVGLSNTSIFLYPDDKNIMVVTFEQDYTSDTVKRRFRKRQYWRMEQDGKWRIFYEGSVT